MDWKKNDVFQTTIEDMSDSGEGIGKTDGFTWFIKDTGFPTLGVLAPGAAADVIVMDYKPFTPFSDANIDGHMLFGMTGRQCQTTMINGKILMRDRVLTEIDEEAVNAHILESSKRLWGKLNH